MDQSQARTLASPSAKEERLARLGEPHVAPLNAWVRTTSVNESLSIPWFDPSDAGTRARVMFLLESPGPMSDAAKGSGIISVDNDDPTAANLWSLRQQTGLMDGAVHWNAVPWYLGTTSKGVVAPGTAERKNGVRMLNELIDLLPELRVIVPMGTHARSVADLYLATRAASVPLVLPTWHPSNLGLNGSPGRREEIASVLRAVQLLRSRPADVPPPRMTS